jgi:hypothetical protein
MATALTDFSKLCVHTLTTKPWNLKQCIKNYSAAGIPELPFGGMCSKDRI